MKRITDQPVTAYQQLAKRMDKRYAATKSWDELPVQHPPGRPRAGEKRERLEVHSIKMTAREWKALTAEAKALGMPVNSLLRSVLRPALLSRVVAVAGLTG